MEEELALADRVVLGPRELVGEHVHAEQPDLVVVDAGVAILKVGPAVADRLDLGASQHDAALVALQHEVVVPSLAVRDDSLVAAA